MARRDVGITLISIGKLAKAAVLVTAGVTFLAGDPQHSITHAANLFGIDPHNRFVNEAVSKVTSVSPSHLRELGVGFFIYASLFLVEGVGLWLQKKWAEWLTLIITASFIPIEIWEIARHASAGKVTVLVLNVAAVVYLAIRRLRHVDARGIRAHA